MEKLKIQRTENGGKGRENGGKGRENGGKGRTLNIEVQILPETCPNGCITDFESSSFLLAVKFC